MNERLRQLAAHIISGLNLEDIAPEDIAPDAPLFGGETGAGLGLDSIDALELAVVVDRRYGVKIADMEIGKKAFASLHALDAYIQSVQAQTGGGAKG